MRALTPYDNELADPEASYRRGFQHGATTLLQLVAAKLDPPDARALAEWTGARFCATGESSGTRRPTRPARLRRQEFPVDARRLGAAGGVRRPLEAKA
jgi:hypothetical protein